jgi:UDP:flavonoid glycosyltransferase YjiC (YdhE family)
MRFLFTAHGAYGHVLPMVPLARALGAAGHDVRVATSPAFAPIVGELGLTAVAAGLDDDALVAEARRRWPRAAEEPPASWAPRMFAEIGAPAMTAELAPIVESWPPDLLVCEEGEHGGPAVARAAGVPWVTHAWGSPVRRGSDHGLQLLDPCPPSLYAPDGPPVAGRAIRTADPPAAVASGAQPLAYVGFGTVPLYRPDPSLVVAVVRALLEHGFDAIVTTTEDELARRLRALDPGRVHVETWITLAEVAGACELIVSHGGAGTVLAALAAGVPLLLIPQGAPSQERMARACAGRGVAVVLIGADDVDQALTTLVGDAGFRDRAQEVRAEIEQLPGPAENAEYLARDLVIWTKELT